MTLDDLGFVVSKIFEIIDKLFNLPFFINGITFGNVIIGFLCMRIFLHFSSSIFSFNLGDGLIGSSIRNERMVKNNKNNENNKK